MPQTMTTREVEHEERNIRQCVALWRACGDTDHDIKNELIMRGHTDDEADRLMRPLIECDYHIEPTPADNNIAHILAGIVSDLSFIKNELRAIRTQICQ